MPFHDHGIQNAFFAFGRWLKSLFSIGLGQRVTSEDRTPNIFRVTIPESHADPCADLSACYMLLHLRAKATVYLNIWMLIKNSCSEAVLS